MIIGNLLALFGICQAAPAGGDVLLDQPPDFRGFGPSQRGAGSPIFIADDFHVEGRLTVDSITLWMVASWPDVPDDWSMHIHLTGASHGGVRGYLPYCDSIMWIMGASEVIDLGPWPNPDYWLFDEGRLHLFEVRFEDIDIRLDPGPLTRRRRGEVDNLVRGIYWIGCEGLISRRRTQHSFRATAGNGDINREPAWIRVEDPTCDWWLYRREGIGPSDYAIRIEGGPVNLDRPTELTEIELVKGVPLEGDITQIRHSDEEYLRAMGVIERQSDYYHSVEWLVRARTEIVEPVNLHVSVESVIDAGGSLLALSIRNWTTGEFDLLGEFPVIQDHEITWPVRNLDPGQYVSETGDVELHLRYWYMWPFEMWIDRVQVVVEPGQN